MTLERSTRTVSLLTLLSRVSGLVRDATLSRLFGAGPLMSAFFFAFMIPNLFRRLFGEGALAAAFLPRHAKLYRDDPATANALASLTVAFLITSLGAVTLALEIILLLISVNLDAVNPTLIFTMLMLPYMPMVCVVAILGAMLQTRGRFGSTAAAPIILNLCMVAAALALAPVFMTEGHQAQAYAARFTHLLYVGAALLLAGVIQIIWSLWALRDQPWWTKQRAAARSEFRKMLILAGPMILSLGILQLNTFFDGIIASYPVTFETDTILGYHYPLDESAMAVLSFAQRLYQFPLGVFGIAVATAIFPLLAAQSDHDGPFVDTLRRGLRLVIFIGLPASVGLILVADPLTAVIYMGGEFSAEQSARVSAVLMGYAPAIWAYSMTHVMTRAFYALDDSKRPVRIALSILALNISLNLILIWFLREVGLALSTAICATIQVVLLLFVFRQHKRGVLDRDVVDSWLRTIIATGLMAGVVWVGSVALRRDDPTWAWRAVELAGLTGVGVLIYGLAAVVMRMDEWRWALGGSRG